MRIAPFFYRVLKLAKDTGHSHLLGTAFPIAPNGGLITCRHVLQAAIGSNESLVILDNETQNAVSIDITTCITPANPNIDMAFIPNALRRNKREFFPLLIPQEVNIGHDVYSYGYFLSSSSEDKNVDTYEINHGYLKGNVVNFASSPKTYGSAAMSLSYAVVEGLSGSPVLTYHNGPKVVGMCYGNIQSRVVASEVIEYKDEMIEFKETISRIVEFGRAHHAAYIVEFLKSAGVSDLIVSSDRVQLAGL